MARKPSLCQKEAPLSSEEQVKRLFSGRVGEWAAGYADPEPWSLSGQTLISRLRFALEMVEASVPPASKILDVGCGTGETAAQLLRRGYEVWGLDVAEPMIAYARRRCGSKQFQVGDIRNMPFRDNTFDAVVCLGVIEYVETDERALREMWRVLKPGGRAVVSTPSAVCPLYHADLVLLGLMAAVRPLYRFVRYGRRGRPAPVGPASPEVAHRRYYRGAWLQTLRSIDLEPEEWVGHGWGWYRSWPLDLFSQLLAQTRTPCRRALERLVGPAAVGRAGGRLARNRALNWMAAEQLVRVRADKESAREPLARRNGAGRRNHVRH
jgi:SAM-dependent methyltransferase